MQLSRPDKLRATRTGGYRDVEIVFDGKMLTVNNKDGKDYAQIEVAGTAEELIDVLREKHGVVAPGADLLLTNVFNVMMTDVVEAAVIGKGVIDGVECDHLAFRNMETDWQIWIESGANPIPRKYVITSKGIGGSAAIHAAHQGVEDRRCGRRLCVQGRIRRSRRSRSANCPISTKSRRAPPRQETRNDPNQRYSVFRSRPSSAAPPFFGAVNCPSIGQSSLVSSAEARIGRPLTPMSYAGVARRTTRRAVADGAVAGGAVAAGAYYAAPVVVAPACSQVVDVYGRVVTVCR